MMTKEIPIILAPCCVLIEGHNYSCIYDLQRNGIYRFSNLYRHLFCKDEITKNWNILVKSPTKKDKEFVDSLLSNQLCVKSEQNSFFRPIDTTSYIQRSCENAIIDRDAKSVYSMNIVANQLSSVACEAVCIRYFKTVDMESIENEIEAFNDSTIRHIEIHCVLSEKISIDRLRVLKKYYGRVCSFVFYSEKKSEVVTVGNNLIIVRKKYGIDKYKMCGSVSDLKMRAQTQFYIESKNYNNCLYRKVYIDSCGIVKNCPEMTTQYGSIDEEGFQLKSIFNSAIFSKCWYITKDKIDQCKDCEFRYACMDCRCFLKEVDNPLSKPAKCKYNPYKS